MVERQLLDSQRGKQMSDESKDDELLLKDIVIDSITQSLKKYLRAFDIACERLADVYSSPFGDYDADLKIIKSEILEEAEKEKE